MKRIFFILLVSLSLIQCTLDDINCDTVLCAGAPPIILQFISEETGEDLFLNQTFEVDALQIEDLGGNPVEFSADEFQGGDIRFFISTRGESAPNLETVSRSYRIFIEDEFDFTVTFNIQRISDDNNCCDGFVLDNIAFEGATVENIPVNDFLGRFNILF